MEWRSGGLPGSGATSFGAAFRGALKSTWIDSSSDGAIVWYSAVGRHWYVAGWVYNFSSQSARCLPYLLTNRQSWQCDCATAEGRGTEVRGCGGISVCEYSVDKEKNLSVYRLIIMHDDHFVH